MVARETRRAKLRRLASDDFDLVIVGGGINGAGIAREAALRGIRTAMLDKGDFGSGTSSRSSKLIHGGLRYLATGEFALVLEASRERDLLRRRLAPHLVRPMPFFFPVYHGGPVGLWKVRAGLLGYDLLAAFRNIERHRAVDARGAVALEPELRSDGLRGGALYYDCFTDDARLVVETVLAAGAAGAVCLNYVGVTDFEKTAGRLSGVVARDLDGEGASIRVRARVVVNAAGPWLDAVRALDEPSASPVLRPTKGAHLVVARERVGNRHAVVLHSVRDRRVLFVIPWEEHTILGTTDTDYAGSPDRVAADAADVGYLLETVNFHFPRARLTDRDVVAAFAGIRPLVADGEGEVPSLVSREERLFESASGLLSLGGGKLTTYRRIAVKVVDRVAQRLRRFGRRVLPRSGTDREPLPGGSAPPVAADALAPGAVDRLVRRYGSRAAALLEEVRRDPDLAAALSPDAPELRAEARFAASSEMAVRVEDVLRRRTTVALRTRDGGASVAGRTARLMAKPLEWSDDQVRRRAEEYREAVGGLAAADDGLRREA